MSPTRLAHWTGGNSRCQPHPGAQYRSIHSVYTNPMKLTATWFSKWENRDAERLCNFTGVIQLAGSTAGMQTQAVWLKNQTLHFRFRSTKKQRTFLVSKAHMLPTPAYLPAWECVANCRLDLSRTATCRGEVMPCDMLWWRGGWEPGLARQVHWWGLHPPARWRGPFP